MAAVDITIWHREGEGAPGVDLGLGRRETRPGGDGDERDNTTTGAIELGNRYGRMSAKPKVAFYWCASHGGCKETLVWDTVIAISHCASSRISLPGTTRHL